MQTIKERVSQLIESKNIIKESFFQKIGMTSANFRGDAKKTPLNSTAIENILSLIPDVNPDWLLTGQGQMLRKIGEMGKGMKKIKEMGDMSKYTKLSRGLKAAEQLGKKYEKFGEIGVPPTMAASGNEPDRAEEADINSATPYPSETSVLESILKKQQEQIDRLIGVIEGLTKK
ncbi:MAG: hypothetical protein LBC84_03095 [Prevotellaceae bacterium]|jgi:hypothetical protein|nr:hypothetical protein [Prevotellaceae bacterium]